MLSAYPQQSRDPGSFDRDATGVTGYDREPRRTIGSRKLVSTVAQLVVRGSRWFARTNQCHPTSGRRRTHLGY